MKLAVKQIKLLLYQWKHFGEELCIFILQNSTIFNEIIILKFKISKIINYLTYCYVLLNIFTYLA